jgi:CopG family nickel-responsive transcriptional regulator
MQRVTISLDESLAAAFDALSRQQGYQSRSEAVRDLVRRAVDERRADGEEGTHCVANLSYVYDHHVRALAQRLIAVQHEHHDLVVATTHIHLDHDSCLESVMLKGPTEAVRALADRIRAERGVRFGALNLISVAPNDHHGDDSGHSHHGHDHLSPHPG